MLGKENNKVANTRETQESTDKYLKISEIRWDVVLMKDDSLRAILRCSWMNIDLKNSREEQIVAERYSRILNSIDFPIQILIRSTYLDLSDYMDYVHFNVSKIDNEVLKWQWEQYYDYIKKLNDTQWYLFTKEFYIVVPFYNLNENKQIKESQFEKIMKAFSKTESAESIAKSLRSLQKNRKHIDQRCSLLQIWLQWIWLETKRLEFDDLVALFFEVYNPLSLKKQSEIIVE